MARAIGGKSPINIMRHMKGLKFPTTKDKILENAKNGPGPDTDQVIEVLQKIPEQEYPTPAQILKATGKKD